MDAQQGGVGKFLDPNAIIAQLDIKNGEIVADFGCGPGYFSLPFSKAVGDDGKVFSLDILPQALESIESKAKNSGIANITTKRVNLEKANGSKLDDDFADWIVLKDVLFQNKDKNIIIAEAYRVLKMGGKVLLIEWNQKESAIGPDLDIRILPETLKQAFQSLGFELAGDIQAGAFHYAFVAVKK